MQLGPRGSAAALQQPGRPAAAKRETPSSRATHTALNADETCTASPEGSGLAAAAHRGRRRHHCTRTSSTRCIPWSPLHAEVQRGLLQRQLIPRGARVLVAVSGGQDSLCLAQLLLDLAPRLQLHLAVAHCDHRMRPDSAACAAYVRAWAAERDLECWEATADALLRSEEDARMWRYAELARLAHEARCSHVATGHTATDRAETLLLNLLRGSGADGLAAMAWQRRLGAHAGEGCDRAREDGLGGVHEVCGPDGSGGGSAAAAVLLVRPLMGVTRHDTGNECRRRGLEPWEDPTNADTRFRRNAVRLGLMPAMEALAPGAEGRLAALAELLSADVECLEAGAARLLEDASWAAARAAHASPRRRGGADDGSLACATAEACGGCAGSGGDGGGTGASGSFDGHVGGSAGELALQRAHLLSAHVALQRRALRLWLRRGLGRAPTSDLVEEARRLLSAPGGGGRSSTLPGGRWLAVEGPLLVLRGWGLRPESAAGTPSQQTAAAAAAGCDGMELRLGAPSADPCLPSCEGAAQVPFCQAAA